MQERQVDLQAIWWKRRHESTDVCSTKRSLPSQGMCKNTVALSQNQQESNHERFEEPKMPHLRDACVHKDSRLKWLWHLPTGWVTRPVLRPKWKATSGAWFFFLHQTLDIPPCLSVSWPPQPDLHGKCLHSHLTFTATAAGPSRPHVSLELQG